MNNHKVDYLSQLKNYHNELIKLYHSYEDTVKAHLGEDSTLIQNFEDILSITPDSNEIMYVKTKEIHSILKGWITEFKSFLPEDDKDRITKLLSEGKQVFRDYVYGTL